MKFQDIDNIQKRIEDVVRLQSDKADPQERGLVRKGVAGFKWRSFTTSRHVFNMQTSRISRINHWGQQKLMCLNMYVLLLQEQYACLNLMSVFCGLQIVALWPPRFYIVFLDSAFFFAEDDWGKMVKLDGSLIQLYLGAAVLQIRFLTLNQFRCFVRW